MATNPMDGYRDIHPWPYAWSKDWDPALDDVLEDVRGGGFPFLDVWTYNNHLILMGDELQVKGEPLDFYQAGGPFPRGQMPKDHGDRLTAWLVSNMADLMVGLVWNYTCWRPAVGWSMWSGKQGDFVDHVHVEFDMVAVREHYGLPVVLEPGV